MRSFEPLSLSPCRIPGATPAALGLPAVLAVLAVLLLAAPPAAATTFVNLPDADLADQAELVASVRVLGWEPGPAGRLPATLYRVEVERVHQGEPVDGELVVHVPGGVAADGVGWDVHGAPEFDGGDRALLFLTHRPDGTWGIVHLMLGAFHEVWDGGRRLAVRDLDGAREMVWEDGSTPPASGEAVRDYDRFTEWIRARAAGESPAPDYRTERSGDGPERVSGAFVVMTNQPGQCGDGAVRKIRWFRFDTGGSVSWTGDAAGQPGMSGGGFAELGRALDAWTDDAGSQIRFVGGGAGTGGDGHVTFDDPDDEIAGSFTCSSGGVLAIGGPWFQCPIQTWKGEAFRPAIRGFVVTQDGAGCYFGSAGGKNGEEVFAHEVGHTLGLSHSTVSDALMRATAWGGGRGARLGADDRNAIAFLYGSGGSSEPPPPSVPTAPDRLAATAASESAISLTWRDRSSDETSFRVERLDPFGWSVVGSTPAGATGTLVTGLAPATVYTFRARACNGAGCSSPSGTATATTHAAAPDPEPEDDCPDGALCLAGGRFTVSVSWRDQRTGAQGWGTPIPGTDKSGYFWFFNSDNVELVAKVLDGRPVNGHWWFFYGALSDVEYTIEVLDGATGQRRTYRNPPGQICGRGDTAMLAEEPASSAPATVSGAGLWSAAAPWEIGSDSAVVSSGLCAPSNDRLCLADGRFEVRVEWTNQHAGGARGVGRVSPPATPGTKSGLFWFFDPANVELVVKMIDGRAVNGHFWFFYGGLSDVDYTIHVRDSVTGHARSYRNRPGEICGRGDTAAF